MKNIAYILAQYPSLTETFIYRELRELKKRGYRIYIFALSRDAYISQNIEYEDVAELVIYRPTMLSLKVIVSIFHFVMNSPFRYISALFYVMVRTMLDPQVMLITVKNIPCTIYFLNEMRNYNIDLIHAHFAFIPATLALIISKCSKVDFGFTAHAWDIYKRPTLLREKIESARYVITCSEYNHRYLKRLFQDENKDKLFMIHHGIDLEEYKRVKPADSIETQSNNIILAVGRLERKKGFRYLIGACSVLKEKNISFKCIIVGEGKERKILEKLVVDNNLGGQVFLTGKKPPREVKSLYLSAGVFVQPSIVAEDGDRDSLPNTLIEALAMEVPSIGTDVAAIPEIIVGGETGLLVDQKNSEKLAEAIEEVMVHRPRHIKMIKCGREKVEQMFDIRKNIDTFEKVIQAL